MKEQSKELKDQIRQLSGNAETRGQAREKALRAIQQAPTDPELRLMLAKLYYLDGLFEFSARELIEVQYLQPTPSVERLLQQFTEYSAPFISRLKSFPSVESPVKSAVSVGQPQASQSLEEDVLADIDVDIDLFDE